MKVERAQIVAQLAQVLLPGDADACIKVDHVGHLARIRLGMHKRFGRRQHDVAVQRQASFQEVDGVVKRVSDLIEWW